MSTHDELVKKAAESLARTLDCGDFMAGDPCHLCVERAEAVIAAIEPAIEARVSYWRQGFHEADNQAWNLAEVGANMAEKIKAARADDAEPTEAQVEAAARALYAEERNESMGFDAWPEYDSPENIGRPIFEEHARAALLAAKEAEA